MRTPKVTLEDLVMKKRGEQQAAASAKLAKKAPQQQTQTARQPLPPAKRPKQLVAVEELEAQVMPFEQVIAQIASSSEQYRREMDQVAKARVQLDKVERELDAVFRAAREAGIDIENGPEVPVRMSVLDQIEAREHLMAQLFIYPLDRSHKDARRLLHAFEFYRDIHRRRTDGIVTFADVGFFLGRLAASGLYRIVNRGETQRRAHKPQSANFEEQTIAYGGKHYLPQGRERAIWLLHSEVTRLVANAEKTSAREDAQALHFLQKGSEVPENVRKLLHTAEPPPKTPVEFSVWVETIRRGDDKPPLALMRRTQRGQKVVSGALVVRVSAATSNPERRELRVLGATRTAVLFLPDAFRTDGSVAAVIEPRDGEGKSATPRWAQDLLTYLYAAGPEALNQLRSSWLQQHSKVKPQSQRMNDPLSATATSEPTAKKTTKKKVVKKKPTDPPAPQA